MSKTAPEGSHPLLERPASVEGPESWLVGSPPSVLTARRPQPSYSDCGDAMSDLMTILFDETFGRYGWPRALAGLDGTICRRAVIWDCLRTETQ